MQNVERILAELVSEYNTVKTEAKTYKLLLDDVVNTTSAKYVTESTAGYFPNRTQPAFLCIRAAVYLTRAAQITGKEQVQALESAFADLEKARWDGVDVNTGKFRPGFLKLRGDSSARSADEYNHKLGELYNYAGDMYEMARGNGVPEIENMFTAISQIVIVASVPRQLPYAFNEEEQEEALKKAENMIKYAIRVAERKYA